ncbi:MAG: hypothetical protein L3J12_09760 [Spirochaetales bacterium]|nr:hypothetical protein [Spirochaetales bacterium]
MLYKKLSQISPDKAAGIILKAAAYHDSLRLKISMINIFTTCLYDSDKKTLKKISPALHTKKWMKLDKYVPVEIKNIYKDLNSPQTELLKRRLIEASITMVSNEYNLIPFQKLDSLKIAAVSIGSGLQTVFQRRLSMYDDVDEFQISKNADTKSFNTLKADWHILKWNVLLFLTRTAVILILHS